MTDELRGEHFRDMAATVQALEGTATTYGWPQCFARIERGMRWVVKKLRTHHSTRPGITASSDKVQPGGATELRRQKTHERRLVLERLIMPMLVRQRGATTCGQACVAMLLGISLDDAIARIGHDGITEDIELLFAVGSELPFVEGPPSPDVVALQKHRDPNGDREHWTLWWKGATFVFTGR